MPRRKALSTPCNGFKRYAERMLITFEWLSTPCNGFEGVFKRGLMLKDLSTPCNGFYATVQDWAG